MNFKERLKKFRKDLKSFKRIAKNPEKGCEKANELIKDINVIKKTKEFSLFTEKQKTEFEKSQEALKIYVTHNEELKKFQTKWQ